MTVSLVLCTFNRAASLRSALKTIADLVIPVGWTVELFVIDNGSTDSTPQVAKEATFGKTGVRYLLEPKRGLSNARNTAISAARGEIIIFTDDDMMLAPDWLVKFVTPLAERKCDAVVGTILLADHLKRPWMESIHEVWLAATGNSFKVNPGDLTGGNMGFHRSVLKRVPLFDHELGPGNMGFGDDSLFAWQLCEAGFRLIKTPAIAIHYPDSSRLLHSQWLAAARQRGASSAYLLHHWFHAELKYPFMQACFLTAKLNLRRIAQPRISPDSEGCAPWELSYVHAIEKCLHFIKERRRPRNYSKRGLVRLDTKV